MTTKLITLHCPSLAVTHPSYVISPFQTPEQVLQGIRVCLGISYAALHTADAKPISDPQSVQEGERVLVAARRGEIVLPDAGEGWVVYQGEELGDEEGELEWEDLTDAEKCAHIIRLTEEYPTTRNILRITRPWVEVQGDIAALTSVPADSRSASPTNGNDTDVTSTSDSASLANGIGTENHASGTASIHVTPAAAAAAALELLILTRWSLPLDTFLKSTRARQPPHHHHHHKSTYTLPLLRALALLSSLTHGQPRLARTALEEAVQNRLQETRLDEVGVEKEKDGVVRVEDVVAAIVGMYEREGSVKVTGKGKVGGRKGEKTRGLGKGKERRRARGRKSDVGV